MEEFVRLMTADRHSRKREGRRANTMRGSAAAAATAAPGIMGKLLLILASQLRFFSPRTEKCFEDDQLLGQCNILKTFEKSAPFQRWFFSGAN